MLIKTSPIQSRPQARQSGVVLIIALVVLVALTLAAVTLVRSVDTSNIIAGNLAFQQAATHSADAGIEDAIAWLQTKSTANKLNDSDSTRGYRADGSTIAPDAGESWDQFWTRSLGQRAYTLQLSNRDNGSDEAGNVVSYVIDRMCSEAGVSSVSGGSCMSSPVVSAATGNQEEANEVQLNAPSVVYYRITVRVAGPRNTVSYVQAMVSL